MRYIILVFFIVNSYGGVLDFSYLQKANEAYSKKDFKIAAHNFSKINDDSARYNEANSLYKQKKYQEALDIYSSIKDKNLQFQKLHNMGNTLAKLNKIDKAIKCFEDALEIKEDKDTRYNLELLKKLKDKKKKDKKQDKKTAK